MPRNDQAVESFDKPITVFCLLDEVDGKEQRRDQKILKVVTNLPSGLTSSSMGLVQITTDAFHHTFNV